MSRAAHKATSFDLEEGGRPDDLFRRSSFAWALATIKLVEASRSLGPNVRVSHPALADIEYAVKLLNGLYIPPVAKTPATAQIVDNRNYITTPEVVASASNLASRMTERRAANLRLVKGTRIANDLSAPVQPRNGKMLWAGVECPVCKAAVSQRCKREDDSFMEKPHHARRTISEEALNT